MRRSVRRAVPAVLLVVASLVLTGCFRFESTYTINDDGTADVSILTVIDTKQLEELGGLLGQDTSDLMELGGEDLLATLSEGDEKSALAIELRKDEFKGMSGWQKAIETLPMLAGLRQTIAQSGNTIPAYRLVLMAALLGPCAALIAWSIILWSRCGLGNTATVRLRCLSVGDYSIDLAARRHLFCIEAGVVTHALVP